MKSRSLYGTSYLLVGVCPPDRGSERSLLSAKNKAYHHFIMTKSQQKWMKRGETFQCTNLRFENGRPSSYHVSRGRDVHTRERLFWGERTQTCKRCLSGLPVFTRFFVLPTVLTLSDSRHVKSADGRFFMIPKVVLYSF